VTRAFVVVNPAAGGGRTERLWPRLRDTLTRLGLDFEWGPTAARGDGVRLARDAARGEYDLVVAVGGDGTLNEVVNGVTDAAGRPLAAVGAVQTGRGRDACRNFLLPTEPARAARRLVEGRDLAFDLGVAQWGGALRYFVNCAGVGFDAEVARRAASRPGAGTLPYLLAVLAALGRHRCTEATIVMGDTTLVAPITAVVVANGAHYGGGMKIAPRADPADGHLDLVVLGALGRLELLRWLPTVYRGTHVRNPKITLARAQALTITGAAPLATHVDGEPGPDAPVTFSIRPKALRLRA
jgi:diacylglycerol kinase (ATP)